MTATGVPTKGAAAVDTSDYECVGLARANARRRPASAAPARPRARLTPPPRSPRHAPYDARYPKVDTLHCSWTTPMCYFATGIGGNGIQVSGA